MENPLSNSFKGMPSNPDEVKNSDSPPTRPAIRTLHSDVAASVRGNNLSITKIALAQQAKNEGLPFVAEEKEHFWSAWSIGTILLVLAGFGVLAGAIVVVMSKNVSLPFTNQEPLAPTLVPVIKRTATDTTRMARAELVRTMNEFTDSNYSSPVALEALILQEMVATTSSEGETLEILTPMPIERLLERMGSRAPGILVRSIGPDMTFGRAGGTPFLMTRAISYEAGFAGMLEWELFMAEDLPFIAKQFTADSLQPTAQPGTGTTVSSSSNASTTIASSTEATSTASTTPIALIPLPPPAPVWKDIIVKNKDVRALVNQDGTIVLLYAFPKNDLIVITQTKEALTLIVDALNAPVFGM